MHTGAVLHETFPPPTRLAAAASRWRDDRTVGALLGLAGALLLAGLLGETPLLALRAAGRTWTETLFERGLGMGWEAARRLVHLLLAGAAACGLAAVFLRRSDAAPPAGAPTDAILPRGGAEALDAPFAPHGGR